METFGLQKLGGTKEQATWKIPSYRSDLRCEVDLIEEIVRVFGISRIPSADRSRFTPISVADRRYDFEMTLRQRLVAHGFSEARTSALVGRATLGSGFAAGAVELRNPLSEDHVALRPTLVPGLIGALERNLRAGAKSVRLFELGRVFLPPNEKEIRRLAVLLCGNAESQVHWRTGRGRQLGFFDLKGTIDSLGLGKINCQRSENPEFALATEFFAGEQHLGIAGQLASSQTAKSAAAAPIFVAEINLPNDIGSIAEPPKFRELQRFPAITRDIAMLAPEELAHDEILAAIQSVHEPLLAEVELFDLFTGKGSQTLGPGRKSLAYSLTYRDKNRTLTHDEVSAAHDRIRERLKMEMGVELRE